MKTKTCTKCITEKPISEFSKCRDSVRAICKLCESNYAKEYRNKQKESYALITDRPDFKFCPTCSVIKPVSEFMPSPSRKYGISGCCRVCSYEASNRCLESLRNRVFEKLGNICKKCSFSDRRALQIDHIYGGGRKDRGSSPIRFLKRVLNDETGMYQILCANCNWIKRVENAEL